MYDSLRRYLLSAAVVVLSLSMVQPAAAAVPADAVQYKCFVRLDSGEWTIRLFYPLVDLSARPSTEELAARELTGAVGPNVLEIIECAREDLVFDDPNAILLEPRIPR